MEAISRVTRHAYVDMPERSRRELGVPARQTQCRQPIIGGGTCLLPADTDWYHIDERPEAAL